MSYCPEDGTFMEAICLHYNACYDCPECETHWNYVNGSYQVSTTDCPVHNYCEKCRMDARQEDK